MSSWTITQQNLDGQGYRPTHTYAMPPHPDYWPAVTDVPCVAGACSGGRP